MMRQLLHGEYLANSLQPVTGDGDTAVYRGIEAKVIAPGAARGE